MVSRYPTGYRTDGFVHLFNITKPIAISTLLSLRHYRPREGHTAPLSSPGAGAESAFSKSAQKAAILFYGMQKVPHKIFHRATGCGWKFRMSSDKPAFPIGIRCCAAWIPWPGNDGALVLLGNHIKNNFFVCHPFKELSLSIILTIILDSIWYARSRNWLSGSKYNFHYFYCGVKGRKSLPRRQPCFSEQISKPRRPKCQENFSLLRDCRLC